MAEDSNKELELREREIALKEQELQIKAFQAANRPMSGGEAAVKIVGALISVAIGLVILFIVVIAIASNGH